METVKLYFNGQRMALSASAFDLDKVREPITWRPSGVQVQSEPVVVHLSKGEGCLMFNRHSSKTFEVQKDKLLAALKENLVKHKETFEVAMRGYRAAMVRKLDVMLKDAQADRDVSHTIRLPRPEDHTEDYERAIQVVEWSVGETFEVTVHEFECFINDKWDWKESFTATTKNYVDGALA